MNNREKIMAILGIINDYKERMYFQASINSKEKYDDEKIKSEEKKLLDAIDELL